MPVMCRWLSQGRTEATALRLQIIISGLCFNGNVCYCYKEKQGGAQTHLHAVADASSGTIPCCSRCICSVCFSMSLGNCCACSMTAKVSEPRYWGGGDLEQSSNTFWEHLCTSCKAMCMQAHLVWQQPACWCTASNCTCS